MKGLFLFVLALLVCASEAQARGRRGWYSGPSSGSTTVTQVTIDPAAQAVAQQRADAMAAAMTLTHSIHQIAAAPNWIMPGVRGEGIGCSSDPNPQRCPTCVVTSPVCADAHALGRDGKIYRVRLFR